MNLKYHQVKNGNYECDKHSKELKDKPTLSWQMIETFRLKISLTISILCLIIVLSK